MHVGVMSPSYNLGTCYFFRSGTILMIIFERNFTAETKIENVKYDKSKCSDAQFFKF